MTTLLEREFTCSLCGKSFKDIFVGSTNSAGGVDSEFREYSAFPQPVAYYIHQCPHCGFIDYSHDEEIEKDEKNQLMNFLSLNQSKHQHQALTPSQKYEQFAGILSMRGEDLSTIALMYLRAAWMADDEEDSKASIKFRDEAVSFFRKALDKNEIPHNTLPEIIYLIGEINRRMGKFDRALQWFARVETEDESLKGWCENQKDLASKGISGKTISFHGQLIQG